MNNFFTGFLAAAALVGLGYLVLRASRHRADASQDPAGRTIALILFIVAGFALVGNVVLLPLRVLGSVFNPWGRFAGRHAQCGPAFPFFQHHGRTGIDEDELEEVVEDIVVELAEEGELDGISGMSYEQMEDKLVWCIEESDELEDRVREIVEEMRDEGEI